MGKRKPQNPKHIISMPLCLQKLRGWQEQKVLKKNKVIFQQRLSSLYLTVQAFPLPLGCQLSAVGCNF